MNICFVENNYPTSKGGGGAGTYVNLVGKELTRQGHKVMVISKYVPGEQEISDDNGIKVFRIRFGNIHGYFSILPIVGKIFVRPLRYLEESLAIHKKILELHKKYSIDMIEFAESGDFWMAFQQTIPYLVNLHGSSYTFKKYCNEKIELGDKFQRLLEGFFIRRSGFIYSPSRFLKNEIKEEFNIDENKMDVVHLPIELISEPRKASRISESRLKTVFYAGRIERRKGAHILVEAIPDIRKECKNTRFCLFGSQSSDLTKDYILNYLRSFGEDENVEINNFIPKESLDKYLLNSDICVIPSIWDNSPYSVYEAMAAGKAVVASKTGGIPDIVEDGKTGFLTPPKNPKALAEAIVHIFKDDTLKAKMGENGRRRILEMCGLKKNVEKRLSIYKKLTDSGFN